MSNNKEVFHQSFELMQLIKDQVLSETFDQSPKELDFLSKKYRHKVYQMGHMSSNAKYQFMNKLTVNSELVPTSSQHNQAYFKHANKRRKYYHVIEDEEEEEEEEINYEHTCNDSLLIQEKFKEPETEASADTNYNEDTFIGYLLKMIIMEEQIIQKEHINKGLVSINYYLNVENQKEKKCSIENNEKLTLKKKTCLHFYKLINANFPDFNDECKRKGVLFLEYLARLNDADYGEKYKATIEQLYIRTKKLIKFLSSNPVKFTNIIYIVFELIICSSYSVRVSMLIVFWFIAINLMTIKLLFYYLRILKKCCRH